MQAARQAVRVLSKERMKPNFGNAGAVNNLLTAAVLRLETRLHHVCFIYSRIWLDQYFK